MNHVIDSTEHRVGQDKRDAIDLAIDYLSQMQSEDGCWQGDYSGPLFLIPSLVITKYILGQPWHEEQRLAIVQYLRHHQNADGGWGLHIEDTSRLYTSCTVLRSVATTGPIRQ